MQNVSDEKCCFSYIYKFDNDLEIGGVSVKNKKNELVRRASIELSQRCTDYDYIAGIPNTGIYYAKLLSKYTGIPVVQVYDKRVSKRTLGDKILERVTYYRQNLRFIGEAFAGKKILFIDEAIFSGVTYHAIKDSCIRNGIEARFFVMSPENRLCCPWKHINSKERMLSIDSKKNDDVDYLNKDAFLEVFPRSIYCTLCFTS